MLRQFMVDFQQDMHSFFHGILDISFCFLKIQKFIFPCTAACETLLLTDLISALKWIFQDLRQVPLTYEMSEMPPGNHFAPVLQSADGMFYPLKNSKVMKCKAPGYSPSVLQSVSYLLQNTLTDYPIPAQYGFHTFHRPNPPPNPHKSPSASASEAKNFHKPGHLIPPHCYSHKALTVPYQYLEIS